ncbi:MAG: hypothetical protein Kow0089_09340 [Desulfobulbaceae bacterium]
MTEGLRSRQVNRDGVSLTRHMAVIMLAVFFLSVGGCGKPPRENSIVFLYPDAKKKPLYIPGVSRRERWKKLVEENMDAPLEAKLASVNDFFNDLEHVEDRYLWDRDDYWASLPEVLERNGGDCEDAAIAKYFTLRYLEIPEESLRLTYVISLKTGKPHMVLTFFSDSSAEPIVLDTMSRHLFPVSKRPDLMPVYSFNSQGYWLARKQESWRGQRLGGPDKLSRWRSVLERMRSREQS